MHNNALDFDLAKSVGEYFRLNDSQMNSIIAEVLTAVKGWESIAKEIGISIAEQELHLKYKLILSFKNSFK